MRKPDKLVFAACAIDKGLWILVRRTNPASLDYIGKPGFVPKPIDCKPKTADFGKFAGLVVSPEIVQKAFSPTKEPEAAKCWKKFLEEKSNRYQVDNDPESEWYGCILIGGNKIHGDYDPYDIVDPRLARRNFALVDTLHGQLHMRSPWLAEIQKWINDRIGSEVVQHSGETQYKDHTDQTIDVFGPNGEYFALATEAAIRASYKYMFDGRFTNPIEKARKGPKRKGPVRLRVVK
jgi:hypothetical protein